MRHVIFTIASLLFITGCAATSTTTATGTAAEIAAEREEQARFVIRTMMERTERLNRLSWPLLTANADVCPRTRFVDGAWLGSRWSLTEHPPTYQRAAIEAAKMHGDRFTITYVTPGTPASEAGLARGDAIVAVDGKPAPVMTSKRTYRRASKAMDTLMTEAMADGHLTLRVARRPNSLLDIDMKLALACAYSVNMIDSDALNAYADGDAIYITTGMMRFADRDLELQTVIAHELAHNTEGHIAKKERNAAVGGLLGTIVDVAAASQGIRTSVGRQGMEAGATAFSQDFEREADYIGIYFLERAGIESSEAADFWRRMALENSRSVVYGRSHPTSPERFVNLNAASEEIREKRKAGQPLLPNRKD